MKFSEFNWHSVAGSKSLLCDWHGFTLAADPEGNWWVVSPYGDEVHSSQQYKADDITGARNRAQGCALALIRLCNN